MANLDFYLRENGRIEYSRDISVVQYSTDNTVRLHTKVIYAVINMNLTTGTGLNTYKKALILELIKDDDGYYVYSCKLGKEATYYEFAGEKAIDKLAFYLYPDKDDQSNVITTSTCYIPVLESLVDRPDDGSITDSELNVLTSEINSINERLESLNIGEIDTAKNYNKTKGNIKEKFDSVDAEIGNLKTGVDLLEQKVDSLDNIGNIEGGLTGINDRLTSLETSNSNLISNVSDNRKDIDKLSGLPNKVTFLETSVNTNKENIAQNKADISDIKNNIIPTLQAGLKYEIVASLPTSPSTGIVYLIRNTEESGEDLYYEYLYINNKWEIIGSTDSTVNLSDYYTRGETNRLLESYVTSDGLKTKLNSYYTKDSADGKFATKTDLNSYYTKTDANNTFTLKSELTAKVKQINNEAGYIKNESGAFSYNNLSDKPTIPTKTSQLTNDSDFLTEHQSLEKHYTKTEVNTIKQNLQSQIDSNDSDISGINTIIGDIQSDLSNTTETANTALALAQSKQFSKVFDTKADMVLYIRSKQTDPLSIGTELLIKDNNVSDYWISAIYSSPTTYTTKFGELFENVYYGVEESESKIDLSDYATREYVDGDFKTNLKSYIDTQDALKVDLSAKSSEISESSTDNQWASALAVKNHVASTKEALDRNISDNANKISALRADLTTTNEKIESYKSELDAKDAEIKGVLENHESSLSTLRTDLESEITNRTTADSTLQGNINALTENLNNYKTEADEKFLDYNETISKAESVVDYLDSSKNLKFASDSNTVEFTISNVDMSFVMNLLSKFGPNEYN